MSLYEQGYSTGDVSLLALFDGAFEPKPANTNLQNYADWICRGGWPASTNYPIDSALYIPDQYLQALYFDNAPRDRLTPDTLRRIVSSLAKNSGATANINTLISDISSSMPDSDAKPARNTVSTYLNYLLSLYIVEDLGGWGAPIKSRARLRSKPKRYFVDPSLPASAMGLNPQRLLQESQIFGTLFETLALRDLRVYTSAFASTVRPELFYYRDDKGLEVDVIIELNDGRWGAIEIKLGENKADEAAKALLSLKKLAIENPYSQQQEPSFLMVLVANAAFAHQRPDGVYVVPLTMLGA